MELIDKIYMYNKRTINKLKQLGFSREEIASEVNMSIAVCNKTFIPGKSKFNIYASFTTSIRLKEALDKAQSIKNIECQLPDRFDKSTEDMPHNKQEMLIYFKSLPMEIVSQLKEYWEGKIKVEEMEKACNDYRLSLTKILDNIDRFTR